MTKPSLVDRRRLADGARAIESGTDFGQMTTAELLDARAVACDGAVAMQSLDDLGSAEANDKAWMWCLELDKRIKDIDAEIAKRGAKS